MSVESKPVTYYPIERALRRVVFNVFWLVLLWLGFVSGHQWAMNVFGFGTFAFALISLACWTEESRNAVVKEGRSVPAWLSYSINLILIVSLAATAHFWLASAWVWLTVSESVLFAKVEANKER